MESNELSRTLGELVTRIDALGERLGAVERALAEAAQLREKLSHETASRRALGDQTAWLIEVLGEARKQVRWLEGERARLLGGQPH